MSLEGIMPCAFIPDDHVQCGSDVVTSCVKLFLLQHTFAALFPQVTTFP